jgi:hypothetical protein
MEPVSSKLGKIITNESIHCSKEKLEDTKGVIRSRNLKDRQCNCQKKTNTSNDL